MTNTITKVTEQCSSLQCFEDVGAGQSVANAQGDAGADAYTECQCQSLFSLAGAPLLFGLFGPEDPDKMREKFEVAQDATARAQLETIKGLEVNLDKYPREERRDAYQLLADSVQNDVVAGLRVSLAIAPSSLVLHHDLAVAHERRAGLLMKAGDNNAASEAFLEARGYVVSYAQTEVANDTASYNRQEGTDYEAEEYLVGSYLDDEKYIVLTDQAAEAKGKSSFLKNGNYEGWQGAVEIYRDAWLELGEWEQYKDEAQEMHDKFRETNIKADVCYWMEEKAENYKATAPQLKEARFEWVLGIVEKALADAKFRARHAGDPHDYGVKYDGITEAVAEFMRVGQLRIVTEMRALPGSGEMIPPRETSMRMARLFGELAVLGASVGNYEMALRHTGTEIRKLMNAQAYDMAMTISDRMISLARVAKLPRYEAGGWGRKARIYADVGNIDNAMAAHEEAIKIYEFLGDENARSGEIIAKGMTLMLSNDPAMEKKGWDLVMETREIRIAKERGAGTTAKGAIGVSDNGRPRAIGVDGEGGLGAIGTERKGEEGKGHGRKERKGRERPGK